MNINDRPQRRRPHRACKKCPGDWVLSSPTIKWRWWHHYYYDSLLLFLPFLFSPTLFLPLFPVVHNVDWCPYHSIEEPFMWPWPSLVFSEARCQTLAQWFAPSLPGRGCHQCHLCRQGHFSHGQYLLVYQRRQGKVHGSNCSANPGLLQGMT